MAKFVEVEDFKGFDGKNPDGPWQLIPQNDTREVKLVEADDDMTCEVTSGTRLFGFDPGRPKKPQDLRGLEFFRGKRISSTDRLIPLHGNKVGSYEFLAINSKTDKVAAQLSVDVVKPRTVAIAYYFLPGAHRWDSRVLNDLAHKIFVDQAAISLKWLGAWDDKNGEKIALPEGKTLDLSDSAVRSALTGYGNHTAADLLVYFSNRPLRNSQGPAAGLTLGGQTLLDSWTWKPTSQREQMVLTLAHEILHFLSSGDEWNDHDPDKDDLLYKSSPHGKRIRKKRNLKIARGL